MTGATSNSPISRLRKVHEGTANTAYSIRDIYRAENSLLTLMAPERIDGMVRALLQDYAEGGFMPKWPNPSYTNIMIATHADSPVAEAVAKGFEGFDLKQAYAAVAKDATVPPDGDTTRRWYDREPDCPMRRTPASPGRRPWATFQPTRSRNQDGVVLLRRFVDQVKAVAPDAGGAAVIFESTGVTIVHAFRTAALTAIGTISLILLIALRRIVDAALVMAPLLLSALGTVVVIVALRLTLNYANIIALPLLQGVGVSFNVYFIMNWRMGQTSVLGSATARAILYSALTTASAFGASGNRQHGVASAD